jgi:hypothetical protein
MSGDGEESPFPPSRVPDRFRGGEPDVGVGNVRNCPPERPVLARADVVLSRRGSPGLTLVGHRPQQVI